jgi:hypothetical protein
MHVRDGMQVFADWRESDRAWLLNAYTSGGEAAAALMHEE